jgi:hypothetical protein
MSLDRDKWRAPMNAIMDIPVSYNARKRNITIVNMFPTQYCFSSICCHNISLALIFSHFIETLFADDELLTHNSK